MKKIIALLFISTVFINAQDAGKSGLSFLKLGAGARNIAMSDFGVVASNDLNAAIYNPSVIALNPKSQLSFTHNSLFKDLNSEFFSGSFSLFDIPIVLGINTTTVSGIEVRTRPGEAESKFDAHYFYGSFSTAYKLYDNLYAGATIKYLYENLFSDDAAGFGFDFGFSFTGIYKNLNIGASIRNIGSMNELRYESTKLPKDFRIGAAYNYFLSDYKLNFTAIGGFQKYLDENNSHLHLGVEVLYFDMFALRGGFITGYDSKNITAGFGIFWRGINIDYAYVPYKYSLGDSNIITFTYSFSK